ncbi:MAG: carbohydrate binding family 9 domain-containing protein [Acidimicrobiia bacterium]|nr:carbohydrate binding family 9 domain-containing protein [Acidimicrobiia bacterium]
MILRDASGRVTARAVRLREALGVDGRLDEAVYREVPPMDGFIQAEPKAGPPATQPTHVWVLFDDDAIYVSVRCWEQYPNRLIADEMRRDSMNIIQNDHFGFSLDTFYDRRNAIVFNVTPAGARFDAQVSDERQLNVAWNPVWRVEVGRFEGGWSIEVELPFKSIRYRPGNPQVWGFQARRDNKWMNEISYLTPMPPAHAASGMRQVSEGATLVGIEVPPRALNLEVKPYLTADLTTDLQSSVPISNDAALDMGVDVKYSLTENLTADLTYNTDFAQVEADEQQVNLTRFSLFFPEKREFFLENQGIFNFGGLGSGASSTPTLFYSRRIGLHQGRAVPITAGARMTGRVGRYSIGALDIRSGDAPGVQVAATNFAVARVKRDVFRRSSVGALVTHRSAGERIAGRNAAYGVDGTFAFYSSLNINTYWARTDSGSLRGDEDSYRAQLDYAGDRYGLQLEHLYVGDNFNPEVGFVSRDDLRRSFAQARFSPRPRSSRHVRKYSWTGSAEYIEDAAGRVETRELDGQFAIEFHNGDRFSVSGTRTYEFLPRPFRIAPGVTLPVAGYEWASVRTGMTLGQQRRFSGTASLEFGDFYNGRRTVVSFSQGRLDLTSRFSIEPSLSVNRVDLPQGRFTATLAGSRVTYTMTPLMFASALLQYNSSGNLLAANVRLRWEYAPGSELFIVYNEQRDTRAAGLPGLANRAFIVKVNRLVRF